MIESKGRSTEGGKSGRPLRVGLVSTRLDPGGKEHVVAHLARELVRTGHQVRVICVEALGHVGESLAREGLPAIDLASRSGPDPRAVLRLWRRLRSEKIDLLHVHDRGSLPYAASAAAAGPPIVLTSHGILRSERGAVRWIERMAARRVRAATAVGPEVAAKIGALLPLPAPVRVIPNGVPLPPKARDGAREARRAELGLGAGELAFFAVGNVKPEKGYEDLVQAARILDASGFGAWRILVAGGAGDGRYLHGIEESAAENGVALRIRFLGRRDDVADLLAAADAFVLPSRSEGMPLALLEAMAAGLPVVATGAGAVPEVLGAGEFGLVVPVGDPRALAAAMARVRGDGELRRRLSDAARARVRAYSTSRMAEGYLAVYREVLGGPRRRSRRRPAVVMTGPLPPPPGGMGSVIEMLAESSLGERRRLAVLDNAKRTPVGRPLAAGVLHQVRLLGRYLAMLRSTRAGLVHLHTCSGFAFWRDVLYQIAARWLGVRSILHVHGALFHEFAGRQKGWRRWILRRALERSGTVVLTGEEWVGRLGPFAPGARFVAVRNGVPVPGERAGLAGTPPRVLHLGSLEPRKGIDVLLAATGKLRNRGLDLELVLAGPFADDAARREILADIERLGLQDVIERPGVVSGAAKRKCLLSADVFVLASRGEGLPIALLEAMAAGLPVVATRVGAVAEAVSDGVQGFLIEPDDPDALAMRLGTLLEDRELRERMGAAGRARVRAELSAERMAADLLRVYAAVESA